MNLFPRAVDWDELALRPLAAGEAAEIGERLAGHDPWRTLGYRAAALASYLERSDPALVRYAIEGDGRLLGVAALRHPWLRGPCLELYAVFEPGRGTGARVLDRLCAIAAAREAREFWALVSDFNASARRFYARRGFVEIAPLPGLLETGRSELLLRRTLHGHAK